MKINQLEIENVKRIQKLLKKQGAVRADLAFARMNAKDLVDG